MFKKTDVKEFKSDLRKLALACLIGSLTGVFLNPSSRIFSLIELFILGVILLYIGLRKPEIT